MTNKQKTYDTVRDHLLAQRKKSINTSRSNPTCLYFGPGELRCAIGCLIPDDLREFVVEGLSPDEQSRPIRKALGIRTADDERFLNDLQNVHDHNKVREWRKALTHFAETYNLRP